jgi:hypothetical protein
MPENHTAERPEYIERIRAEARGLKYRPASRLKFIPQPADPEACRYIFSVATGNRWWNLANASPRLKCFSGSYGTRAS